MEQRFKGFREFLIRDLCRPEPAEVYCRPHVVRRGILGAGLFGSCVGLTLLVLLQILQAGIKASLGIQDR
ncbi:MAG: hypothetical protein GXZ00_05560 [Synergistaceae bacterium]|nr:hypothetical protein [Synergistaceae bacterium]